MQNLDTREIDGLTVSLDIDSDRCPLVTVDDAKTGEHFTLRPEPSKALDAFHHPYAYLYAYKPVTRHPDFVVTPTAGTFGTGE